MFIDFISGGRLMAESLFYTFSWLLFWISSVALNVTQTMATEHIVYNNVLGAGWLDGWGFSRHPFSFSLVSSSSPPELPWSVQVLTTLYGAYMCHQNLNLAKSSGHLGQFLGSLNSVFHIYICCVAQAGHEEIVHTCWKFKKVWATLVWRCNLSFSI